MYRKSSKGNPWHDAKGRFTSPGMSGGREVKTWASFGEKHSTDDLIKNSTEQLDTKKDRTNFLEKVDQQKTKTASTDGRRHYHNQSIDRESHAKSLSVFAPEKGKYTRKEISEMRQKQFNAWQKENSVALKNGGKAVVCLSGINATFQVVQSQRMASEVYGRKSRTQRNTSTSMKPISGYSVEYFKNNEVRSTTKNPTMGEVNDKLSKFCRKYKSKMGNAEVSIKVWNDGKQIKYMPVYTFKNKADAEAFAKDHGGRVVDNDDGYQA